MVEGETRSQLNGCCIASKARGNVDCCIADGQEAVDCFKLEEARLQIPAELQSV